jgi:hypothetical protein
MRGYRIGEFQLTIISTDVTLTTGTREADWAPRVRVIPRLGGFRSRSRQLPERPIGHYGFA